MATFSNPRCSFSLRLGQHPRALGLLERQREIFNTHARLYRCEVCLLDYAVIADAYEKIEVATKRLEMTDLLVALLKITPKTSFQDSLLDSGQDIPRLRWAGDRRG